MFIKDLRLLEKGRDLKNIIIVDNNMHSFYLQLRNGIPIYDYLGNKHDQILMLLTQYLLQFKEIDDVRDKIEEDFKIKELLEEKA